MNISIYDIIQGPVYTAKAADLVNNLKKVVIKVHPQANKIMIKEALERLFNVKVASVRTIVRKGKVRTVRRHESQGATTKRAIVTLKKGYELDLAGQQAEQQVSKQQDVAAAE
jgi:large subunit ribosomal protein L23